MKSLIIICGETVSLSVPFFDRAQRVLHVRVVDLHFSFAVVPPVLEAISKQNPKVAVYQ